MGIINLLSKAVDALPVVMDILDKCSGDSSNSSNVTTGDPDELIEECEEYLLELSKYTIDDLDQFLDCLTKFERRWLKLDRIDCSSDDKSISDELNHLDQKKEKAIERMEKDFDELLDKIDADCKAENDPEKWQALTEKWYEYFNEKNRILDHRFEFSKKLSKQACDFLNG